MRRNLKMSNHRWLATCSSFFVVNQPQSSTPVPFSTDDQWLIEKRSYYGSMKSFGGSWKRWPKKNCAASMAKSSLY